MTIYTSPTAILAVDPSNGTNILSEIPVLPFKTDEFREPLYTQYEVEVMLQRVRAQTMLEVSREPRQLARLVSDLIGLNESEVYHRLVASK